MKKTYKNFLKTFTDHNPFKLRISPTFGATLGEMYFKTDKKIEKSYFLKITYINE